LARAPRRHERNAAVGQPPRDDLLLVAAARLEAQLARPVCIASGWFPMPCQATFPKKRHTFASRLVMAGVDLRSVQTLGGWRTLTMVQRYSHLAPQHLRDAVERLIGVSPQLELARN
jgi:integrase